MDKEEEVTPIEEEEEELAEQSQEEKLEGESEESDKGNKEATGGFIELPPTTEQKPNLNFETPEPAPPGTPIRTFYELSGSPPTAPGLAMKYRSFKKEPEKIVYLTIDDGPSENTLPILEILRKEEVKATFFVIGSQVEKYPDILRMTHAEGHAIGNH
ncbi:MAG: polysaccharide deacetylase family protein, partial [Desulfitobacterium sp.]|nr:polysaccharide deacetylase family protein [Desulfitobacterium sp.]